MKKLIWAALTLSILATASRAQETPLADVAVGYSHFHIGEFGGRFRLMESTKELHQTPSSNALTAEPEQTRRFTRCGKYDNETSFEPAAAVRNC